jgi:serine protease AprX
VILTPCPICHTPSDPRILSLQDEVDPTIAAFVAQRHPHWTLAQGICPACLLRQSETFARLRSSQSLHTLTDPPTTFPYYHPAEETVLSQPLRLPYYGAVDGAGVTIAFLDSGFYPHPDLLRRGSTLAAEVAGRQLTERQWQSLLEHADTRLIDYVDLTDGGEQVGLQTPSLWDAAGDSWHGQMTTTIAAGSGLLSGGRYRGFAPGASVLPIKIGRGGGRIPEEDILSGLNWLLRDDNWQRLGVRVVNISVGGDFPEPWQLNLVCRAAHALAQRGVLVAAAAGNRGVEELLAPAQTPTVLTVGGVDDRNLPWRSGSSADLRHLELYHHNYGSVAWQHTLQRKPELLALARWLPSPILPPSSVLRESAMIARLREVLSGEDERASQRLLSHWQRAMHGAADWPANSPSDLHGEAQGGANGTAQAEMQGSGHGPGHGPGHSSGHSAEHTSDAEMMPEVWHALRRRMNAHKWVDPYYQHVDGTSVSVAQVSAVAAQMFAANPALNGDDVRGILLETALPLPHLLPRQTGAQLLQPAPAVAAALRAAGGPLAGLPLSGSRLRDFELQKWAAQGTLAVLTLEETPNAADVVYFGCYAPDATHVSLAGSFSQWLPDSVPLQPHGNGWWHVAVLLPKGIHLYRFWVESPAAGQDSSAGLRVATWRRDEENTNCLESGYRDGHSAVVI